MDRPSASRVGVVILPPKYQEEEERFEKVPIRYSSSSNIGFLLKSLDRDCYGVHTSAFFLTLTRRTGDDIVTTVIVCFWWF